MIKTPSEVYNDGKLSLIPKLGIKLKETLKTNKMKAKQMIFTINSTSILTREIILPSVKPEEMSEMIKYDIEQYMPVSIDEYDIEYKIIEEFEEEGSKKSKVLVAAVQKEIVLDYISLAKELGLNIVAIDITSNSVSKLFETSNLINNESYSVVNTAALIDLGYNTITVNFIANGKLQFSRVIPRGGVELEPFYLKEEVAVSAEAVTTQINRLDLFSGDELNDGLKTVIDNWLQEIQRILQYYSSRSNKNTVEKVFVYGGYAGLKGIDDYFKSALGLPVLNINTISNIKVSDGLAKGDLKHYLNPIGAIIRR